MRFCLTSILVLVSASAVVASPVLLDQVSLGAGGLTQGVGGSPGTPGDPVVAQSFTAGLPGTLNSVDVFVNKQSVSSIDLVAEIYNAAGGVPIGAALGSTTVSNSMVPTPHSFLNVDFSGFGIPVSVGSQFAIVLHDDNKADKNTIYTWGGSSSDSYAGGSRSYDVGSGFVSTGSDLYFKTYVETIPEPTTLALLAFGLGVLIWRRKRAA